MLLSLYENKNYKNFNLWYFLLALMTFDLCHTQSLALLQMLTMPLYRFFAEVSNSLLTAAAQILLYRVSPGTWKAIGRGLSSDQLRMRVISHCKHTKLKNTKIYSKGALVNHTKISTNENFPLYGSSLVRITELSQVGIWSVWILLRHATDLKITASLHWVKGSKQEVNRKKWGKKPPCMHGKGGLCQMGSNLM
jgi:hypothetical protein